MKRFDVYLMTPYASWEGVRADNESIAIALCEPGVWPDENDGPVSFLAMKVETVAEGEGCPRCSEDRVNWLIWDTVIMEITCRSCGCLYQL